MDCQGGCLILAHAPRLGENTIYGWDKTRYHAEGVALCELTLPRSTYKENISGTMAEISIFLHQGTFLVGAIELGSTVAMGDDSTRRGVRKLLRRGNRGEGLARVEGGEIET